MDYNYLLSGYARPVHFFPGDKDWSLAVRKYAYLGTHWAFRLSTSFYETEFF